MNCQEVMELMQRQLDDDLSDAELEVLMNHTRQCPDCAAMLERMKRLSAELTALPKVTPTYSLVDAILPELERLDRLASHTSSAIESDTGITAKAVSEPRRMPRKRRWATWSAIGSVVAAGLVAGLFIVNDPSALKNSLADKMSYSMEHSLPEVEDTSTANLFRQMTPTSGQSDLETKSFDKRTAEGSSAGGDANSNPEAGGDVSIKGTSNNSSEQGNVTGIVKDQYGSTVEKPGESDVSKEDHPGMGITSVKEFASPDGRFIALLEQHTIAIVSADNGKTVKQTSRKNGQHGQVAWSEDSSQLTYEVQLDRGAAEKYVIETSNWKEKKATH
ncbi:anti-sigma factor family protein [Paenibacillus paeoniae]|uniref:Anti-sigma-W factor RsiW n=1 Tax=Paenibacillus paeoniae TaxID=2292705 RepID=A0A371PMK6_9BACL|nr:zf-HC2 domain-containing protein [Paenibacillus paeoniae]REK77436.1 hypothetical protein DX130_10690 [Paenibacillus paeoniae]